MRLMIIIVAFISSTIATMAMEFHPTIASEWVGIRKIAVSTKERGSNFDVTIWYPAQKGGKPVVLGENAFFAGTKAMLEAPIASGKYPLILLSHGAGLGGNAQAMSWIATPLAKQGFIVAAPTHPGNTGANRSAAETMKLWMRAADISATLDAIETQSFLLPHVAHGKIGVLGFSMGGNTVLSLAGARIAPFKLASYCDNEAVNPSLCNWVSESGVNLHTIDTQQAGRSNIDKRIKFAIAIDPTPADIFNANSLAEINIPMVIMNLGNINTIPQTALGSEVAKAIPSATYVVIKDASHYSLFNKCKNGTADLAISKNINEPICSDGNATSRHEVHDKLIHTITRYFSLALKPSQ